MTVQIAFLFCHRIFQYSFSLALVVFTWWFLFPWCSYVITFQKQEHQACFLISIELVFILAVTVIAYYWIQEHWPEKENGKWFSTVSIRICTSFPTNDFISTTPLALQRLPKHRKRNMIKSIFFLTQGKTSGRKLKHKRSKALSIIILSKLFHFLWIPHMFSIVLFWMFSVIHSYCDILFWELNPMAGEPLLLNKYEYVIKTNFYIGYYEGILKHVPFRSFSELERLHLKSDGREISKIIASRNINSWCR